MKLFDVKFTVFLHRFPLTLFFIVVSRLAYSCCSYVRIRTNSAFWIPTHCPNTNLNLRIKTEPVTDGADPTRYMSGNGLNTAKIIYFSIYVCIPLHPLRPWQVFMRGINLQYFWYSIKFTNNSSQNWLFKTKKIDWCITNSI